MQRDRKFFQNGINMYVKAAQFMADVIDMEPATFDLGSPATSNPTAYATGIAANSAANTDVAPANPIILDSTYGRTLILTPSGDPGNSFAIDVYGTDYLGQPMIERFTGASGQSVAIAGKKAFYRYLKSRTATPSTNAVTFSVGSGVKLGLPYKGNLFSSSESGVIVSITSAFTLPDLTDPATRTTGDPRGTFTPVVAPSGRQISVDLMGDNWVNSAGNGGFHGIQQFYA